MKYVFDTTAYSELLRGHKDVAEVLKSATEILVPHVVIAELQYGFCLGSKRPENEQIYRKQKGPYPARRQCNNRLFREYCSICPQKRRAAFVTRYLDSCACRTMGSDTGDLRQGLQALAVQRPGTLATLIIQSRTGKIRQWFSQTLHFYQPGVVALAL